MLEYVLYRKAAAVTGQSEEILSFVGERAQGAPRFLVTNGVEARRFGTDCADSDARAIVGDAPGPIFMYAGLLGLAQGLDQILDLARDLPPDVPGRFVLVGDGPVRDHIADRIHVEGLSDRVRLVPPSPANVCPRCLPVPMPRSFHSA